MAKGTLDIHAYLGVVSQPSTVTPAGFYASRTAMQRQQFHAKGLHWVFYLDNWNIWYRTSLDDLVWSAPVNAATRGMGADQADLFSLVFDGTYVHWTLTKFGPSPPNLYYRRGTPNSDGIITWDTDEQAIDLGGYFCDQTITIDSNGYPWLGVYDARESQWVPSVLKSARNDGVWETDWIEILNPNRPNRGVIVVPLTGGKVYAIYFLSWKREQAPYPPAPIYGKLWNGFEWSEEEQVSVSKVNNSDFNQLNAVADGDDVYLAFLKYETHDIIHVKRTAGVGWGAEEMVQPSAHDRSSPVLCYSRKEGKPYCFWADEERIFYRTRLADNVWSDLVEWVVETESIFEHPVYQLYGVLQCFYEDYGDRIGVVWWLPTSGLLRYNYIKTLNVSKEVNKG